MIGQLIGGRYRIRGQIGEGGMATVYTAIDERLDRRVAIKIMHAKLAEDKDLRQRFLLEAKTLSSFDHPNIIRIFDYSGDQSDDLWIVTEILQGYNLSQFVRRFPNSLINPILACFIVDEVCSALSYAHGKGIFHRDVKPENIFILRDGRVKLMDFGIAKDINRGNITMTGAFMGSPSYMSPEQIRGTYVDARSDIYSLSIMFYEIVTGKLPFPGSNPSQVINKIMLGKYLEPGIVAPWLPEPITRIIVQGMSNDPALRFSAVEHLRQQLKSYLASQGFSDSSKELGLFFKIRPEYEKKLAALVPIPHDSKIQDPLRKISRTSSKLHGPKLKVAQERKQVARNAPFSSRYPPARHVQSVQTGHEGPTLAARPIFAMIATAVILIGSMVAFVKFNNRLEKLRRSALAEAQMQASLRAMNRDKISQIQKLRRGRDQHRPLEIDEPRVEKSEPELESPGIPPRELPLNLVLTTINVEPVAEVVIDGKSYGESSGALVAHGIPLAPGPHFVSVQASGFRSQSRTITVQSGKPLRLNFVLQPDQALKSVFVQSNKIPSTLIIVSSRNSSKRQEVQLDAENQKIELSPGEYDVVFYHGNYRVEKQLTVPVDGPAPIVKANFEQ